MDHIPSTGVQSQNHISRSSVPRMEKSVQTTPEQSMVRITTSSRRLGLFVSISTVLRIVFPQKSWRWFLTAPFLPMPYWIQHYFQENDPRGAILSVSWNLSFLSVDPGTMSAQFFFTNTFASVAFLNSSASVKPSRSPIRLPDILVHWSNPWIFSAIFQRVSLLNSPKIYVRLWSFAHSYPLLDTLRPAHSLLLHFRRAVWSRK